MDLTIDRRSKDITAITVEQPDRHPRRGAGPPITELIARYDAISDPLANRVIGSITADITRAAERGRRVGAG